VWDFALAQLEKTNDAERRWNLLAVLSSTRRPELVPRARALALDPRLRATEALSPISTQMQVPTLRESTWAWTKAHFDELLAVIPAHNAQTQVIGLGDVFCDEAHARDLEAFFTPARLARIAGGPRVLATTLESIRVCAARREQQAPSARSYFGEPLPGAGPARLSGARRLR